MGQLVDPFRTGDISESVQPEVGAISAVSPARSASVESEHTVCPGWAAARNRAQRFGGVP
jgi:hypothetical protein